MKLANVFGVIGLVLVGLMVALEFSNFLKGPVGDLVTLLAWTAFGCFSFACVKGSRWWWLVPLAMVSLVVWSLWLNVRG